MKFGRRQLRRRSAVASSTRPVPSSPGTKSRYHDVRSHFSDSRCSPTFGPGTVARRYPRDPRPSEKTPLVDRDQTRTSSRSAPRSRRVGDPPRPTRQADTGNPENRRFRRHALTVADEQGSEGHRIVNPLRWERESESPGGESALAGHEDLAPLGQSRDDFSLDVERHALLVSVVRCGHRHETHDEVALVGGNPEFIAEPPDRA